MLPEILENLDIESGKLYFDGTLGGAGHSQAIQERLNNNGSTGTLISFDQDKEVIKRITKLANAKNWTLVNKNFEDIWTYCKENNLKIDGGIVLDLGLSSIQLDDPERGFNFLSEAALDMRMNQNSPLSADELVNRFSEKEIADILYKYGEERKSRMIAKEIVQARPINSCLELAELIKRIYVKTSSRKHSFKIHPATKSFQALRIFVNSELEALENFLKLDFDCLEPGARINIISFHSLEDRIVKNAFRYYKQEKKLELIYKKPLTASKNEIENNARSRSAKLRVAKVL